MKNLPNETIFCLINQEKEKERKRKEKSLTKLKFVYL